MILIIYLIIFLIPRSQNVPSLLINKQYFPWQLGTFEAWDVLIWDILRLGVFCTWKVLLVGPLEAWDISLARTFWSWNIL
jgi:hypothetical protein